MTAPTVQVSVGAITADPYTTPAYTPSTNGDTVVCCIQTGSLSAEGAPTVTVASGQTGQASFGSQKMGGNGLASTIGIHVFRSRNGSSPTSGTLSIDWLAAPTAASVIILDYPSGTFDPDTAFPMLSALCSAATTSTSFSQATGGTPATKDRVLGVVGVRNNGNIDIAVGSTFSGAGGGVLSGTSLKSATNPYATACVLDGTNMTNSVVDATCIQNVGNMLAAAIIQAPSTTVPVLVRDNQGAYTTTSSPSLTVTTPVTGDALILEIGIDSSSVTVSSISGCGATWAKVSNQSASTAGLSHEIWIGKSCSSAGPVSVTLSGSASGHLRATEWKNLSGTFSTPVKTTNGGATSSTQDSGAYTPTAGQLIFSFVATLGVNNSTASNGYTFDHVDLTSVGATVKIKSGFVMSAPGTTASRGTFGTTTSTTWSAITVGFDPVNLGATVTGVTATGSSAAYPGTVTASGNIAGAVATASALASPGTPSGGATVAGAVASATSTAYAGTITGASNVAGARATASALASVGTPSGGATVNGAVATGSATAYVGTPSQVAGSANVPGAVATASATAYAGVVQGSATVAGALASGTAQAYPGQINGGAIVNGAVATATSAAYPGTITTSSNVNGAVATATATAHAGTVSAGSVVLGATATGIAAAYAGSVNGGATIIGVVATGFAQAYAATIITGATVEGAVATALAMAYAGVPREVIPRDLHILASTPSDRWKIEAWERFEVAIGSDRWGVRYLEDS